MGCSSLGVRVGVERGWRGVESLGGCCGAVVLWCTGVKEARSNARCAWSEGPPSLPRWREARGRGAVLALAGPSRPHGRAACAQCCARLSSRIFFTSLREFCLAVGLLPDTTSDVTIDFSSTSRAYRVGITWL